MKTEHKELLLQDLSARIPYGVKASVTQYRDDAPPLRDVVVTINLKNLDAFLNNSDDHDYDIKPYLFPLSSMTEEQFNEMYNYCYNAEREASKFSNGELKVTYGYELFKFDYLNKNHFDYRGLIPMGLAEDATGLNIY